MKKLILFVFSFLLLTNLVNADVIFGDVKIIMPDSNITLTGNYSQIDATSQYLIINDSFKFNSTMDIVLKNVRYYNDILDYTIISSSDGKVNTISKMANSNKEYYMWLDDGNPYYSFSTSDPSGWIIFPYSFSTATENYFMIRQVIPLSLIYPGNNTNVSYDNLQLIWEELPKNPYYTYQISTDPQFLNIIYTGTIYDNSNSEKNITSSVLSLDPSTKYYWRVKNYTSPYTDWDLFTTINRILVPGRFNITVFDEQNTSHRIMNFTIQLYNTTSYLSKTTTTGWVNFSSNEVSYGEYLIITIPESGYYQRMVLATSPTNVTMYVPSSSETIDLVSFSLLDVTGYFPYQTSTISILKGGLVMDKSYFSADGTHSIYLIDGNNYQISIQNGDNIQNFANYVPTSTGTYSITINDFSTNESLMEPFSYNITSSSSDITLYWSDNANILNNLSFIVYNVTNMDVTCSLQTTVKHGQSVCSINSQTTYYVTFNASTTQGWYTSSFFFDPRTGTRKASTGTSPIDNSPIGIGFKWNYNGWTTQNWIYNWISLIFIIALAGTFGSRESGIGGILTGIIALLLETVGWFRPLGDNDPNNTITMSITGAIVILSFLYYLQHKDRGGT